MKKQGFTLIEMLLYMAILSVILLALSSFAFMSFQSRIKNQTIAEVEQQGNQIMDIILQTARNSATINSPSVQASGTSLSLNTYNVATTPTVFSLVGNNIQIVEGSGSAVNLTSGRVAASAVTFSNLSESGAPGTVRVQFTLSYINNAGTNEYDFTKTFYGTASLRWP